MKQTAQSGVILITGCAYVGAYVTDDFGNLVRLDDDGLDSALDRFLNASVARKLGLPC